MSDAAAQAMLAVSDNTLVSLNACVLTLASREVSDGTLADISRQLADLAESDPHFSAWCDTIFIGTAASKRWSQLAGSLPQRLVHDAPWLSSRAFSEARISPSKTLWETCNLVIRLQSVETSVANELDRRKTDAIYNFAYGLSHELNNPLANIATRAGVLLRDCKVESDRQLLTAIIDNAMRGCDMLGDLMLIARPPQPVIEGVNPHQLLENLLGRIQPHTDRLGIEVQHYISDDLPSEIQTDAVAFCEAMWCVVRNAIEALGLGGKIDVSVRAAALTRDANTKKPPSYLHWQVCDDGAGLSDKALKYCFDPYYSGREAGRGLGVGLAKAKRIIEGLGGKISVANRASGTCAVIVLLPSSV